MQYTRELLPHIASIGGSFDEARSRYMNDHETFQIEKDTTHNLFSLYCCN